MVITDGGSQGGGENAALGTPKSGLLTALDDIIELDRALWEVTKGLPIRTGSILRVSAEDLHRWRVGVTEENRAELARLSEAFRLKDNAERERNPALENIERTSFSQSMRSSMARVIAFVIKELVAGSDDGKREYDICDLACGRGRVATAIATALRSDNRTRGVFDRVVFHMVDYSSQKLHKARIGVMPFDPKAVRLHAMSDEEFLAENKDAMDFVVSMCHFHKSPFSDTLRGAAGALKENGVLVSGDWHSLLSSHPALVYQLFESMRVETRRLDLFKSLMGDALSPDSMPDMSMEELRAVADHQGHWNEVYHDLLQGAAKSAREPRFYVLGAFDTTRRRVEKLEEAGLITDGKRISAAFPKAKLPPQPKRMIKDSDRASVVMGLKGR